MPIRAQWDNPEKTVVTVIYTDAWTWDEYYAATKEAKLLMETVPHRVDVIADMVKGKFPTQGPAIAAAQNVLRSWPDNFGCLVIVSSGFIQALVSIFKQIERKFGPHVHSARTVAEAQAIIQRERTRQGIVV
jgi:hypothetical protein